MQTEQTMSPVKMSGVEVPRRRMFGWLETALLLAAVVLAYQFLPPHYTKPIAKWTTAQWKWFLGAIDVRYWSLTARMILNGLVVFVLIFYRSIPSWKAAFSVLKLKRNKKVQIKSQTELEKERALLLEHYKKMHEVEKVRNQ